MPAETASQSAPLLLPPREAARLLSLCEKTLWTLTNRGDIPALWIGRAKRYAVSDLTAWIERQRAAGKGGKP